VRSQYDLSPPRPGRESAGCFNAYIRAVNYIQIGERLQQPRTPETPTAYARVVELFKKSIPDVPFLSSRAVARMARAGLEVERNMLTDPE
jgi:hypothetical protein